MVDVSASRRGRATPGLMRRMPPEVSPHTKSFMPRDDTRVTCPPPAGTERCERESHPGHRTKPKGLRLVRGKGRKCWIQIPRARLLANVPCHQSRSLTSALVPLHSVCPADNISGAPHSSPPPSRFSTLPKNRTGRDLRSGSNQGPSSTLDKKLYTHRT